MTKQYKIAAFILLLSAIVIYGCKKEENYPPLTLGNSTAPIATLEHIADSLNETYTYISFSSNMDGDFHYVALEQGSETPSVNDVILGNTTPAATTISVKAKQEYTIKVDNLISLSSYNLYAVASNATEGKPGALMGPISITCPDNTSMQVVSMVPATGTEGVSASLDSIIITFDETIDTVYPDRIRLIDISALSLLSNGISVSYSGSNMIIEISDSIPFNTEVGIILDEGACSDESGNNSPLYATVDNDFVLHFSTEELVTFSTEIFNGAYHCVANELWYETVEEYDVIIKDSSAASGNYLKILNFNDDISGSATLTLYLDGDSAHFENYYTGIVDVDYGEIFVSDFYSRTYSTAPFYQGSFERDGSIITAWAEVYNADYSYWYAYELTFTKYDNSAEKSILEKLSGKGVQY